MRFFPLFLLLSSAVSRFPIFAVHLVFSIGSLHDINIRSDFCSLLCHIIVLFFCGLLFQFSFMQFIRTIWMHGALLISSGKVRVARKEIVPFVAFDIMKSQYYDRMSSPFSVRRINNLLRWHHRRSGSNFNGLHFYSNSIVFGTQLNFRVKQSERKYSEVATSGDIKLLSMNPTNSYLHIVVSHH